MPLFTVETSEEKENCTKYTDSRISTVIRKQTSCTQLLYSQYGSMEFHSRVQHNDPTSINYNKVHHKYFMIHDKCYTSIDLVRILQIGVTSKRDCNI